MTQTSPRSTVPRKPDGRHPAPGDPREAVPAGRSGLVAASDCSEWLSRGLAPLGFAHRDAGGVDGAARAGDPDHQVGQEADGEELEGGEEEQQCVRGHCRSLSTKSKTSFPVAISARSIVTGRKIRRGL